MNPTIEAENAVLAVVLATSGEALDDLTLTAADFTEPGKQGALFDAMHAEHAAGRPVDAFTLSARGDVDAAEVWALTSVTANRGSLSYYVDIVARASLRRRLATVGAKLAQIDAGLDASAVADAARGLVDEAIGTPSRKIRYVADVLPDVIARLDAKDTFVPSPWPSLNSVIGGFRPGAVYVVAARPGIGKTVIAAQCAVALAEHGHVAFSSLEMTDTELVARMISERLRINVGKIKDARMATHDWQVLADGRSELESLRIAIDDRSGVSASDVRGFARAVSRQGKLAGVVVDYLQLMVSKSRLDRHLQVAEFSRQLKIMAKDFHVPVIALSQLNRNSESSSLATPKLSDLRESGAIEQDADCVMLLRREGDVEDPRAQVDLVIDVAKNRHGPIGEVKLAWDGMHSRAVEWGAS